MLAKSLRFVLCAGCLCCALARSGNADEPSLPLKAGIIGMDAHALAWTRILNDPNAEGELADMKVVAGYPGGSPDIPQSMELLERPGGADRRTGRRDRRFDRRTAAEGRRRDDPEHRRTDASGAGTAGLRGGQAGVHRQADRRVAQGSDRDFSAGRRSTTFPVFRVRRCGMRRRRPTFATTRRWETWSAATNTLRVPWSRIIPISSGTAFTASSRCSRSWEPDAFR